MGRKQTVKRENERGECRGYKNHILKGSPKYFEKIKERNLGKNKLDFIHLNLPPICNYDCAKCSTKNTTRNLGEILTLKEIKNVLKEGKNLGAAALVISGEGEPLMNGHFFDIIDYAHALGLISIIATNGSLLDEGSVQFLYGLDVTLLISLDTIDKEKYSRQCRIKDKFNRILENIELVKRIYGRDTKTYNGARVYRAGIHTIVNAENLEELDRLRRYCRDDLFFSVGYIANHGNASNNQQLIKDYEQVKKAAEKYGEAFLICKSEQGFPVCGFFYYGLTVGCDGEILLADHALETAGLIGNIRTENLDYLRRKVSTMINSFYNTRGRCYCPIRDPYYLEFVERCQNEKDLFKNQGKKNSSAI